jgi:UDP-N-acetylmuramyl pentapeptide phosphotransferase/UDP-N-acetylglucosamine-1-phosphate transferase
VAGVAVERAQGLAGLALSGAALGFLWWNWHPARIFLGDVGSVPLGFVIGGLLLGLVGAGYWAAALILPLYYLADASITLLRRLFAGQPIWRAHRDHYYQRAAAGRLGHAGTSTAVAILDIVLIALAILAASASPMLALLAAAVLVAALLTVFGSGKSAAPRAQ